MRSRVRQNLRFLVTITVLAVVGLASAAYVLYHQRAPVPFRDTYEVNVEMTAADGVAPGLGQPVAVAGVKVGSITAASLVDGNALITLQIDRGQLPKVYGDATATLVPITPLKDMRIDLDPGNPPAPELRDGATLGVERSSVPVPLSDLLSSLDLDTRTFLQSLVTSFDQGTAGRGEDLRRALVTLGPTTNQVGRITRELAQRRTEIARLVHNLALVTRAASRDRQLGDVIVAGNATLAALAEQDAPLRASIAKLPGTLETTRATLVNAATFADKLGPTTAALLPAVRRLPATLLALRPFADTGTRVISKRLRPFVREARPLVRDLAPAITTLNALSPELTTTMQVSNSFLNTFAYNPPGNDEGFLFWFSWFAHNWNSLFGTGDAHGGIGRAMVMVNCQQFSSFVNLGPLFQTLVGAADLCP
jgi:phospholipid/cholesterol/gamma-HCH transport system substrate-binding protein